MRDAIGLDLSRSRVIVVHGRISSVGAMRLITWNVNSVRARLPRVIELLVAHAPDVVCIQETKVASEAFPRDELQALGYHVVEHSEGRWNGVALLVAEHRAVTDVTCGLPGEPHPDEARWVEATVDGVRIVSVYVPNGREPSHPMFAAKLTFLAAASERAMELLQAGPLVIAGDFNVAPTDVDVWDPAAFEGATHVTEPERQAIERMIALGLADVYRTVDADEPAFTWWDYRMGAFRRGMGMRIDLVLASPALEVQSATVDTAFRRNNDAGDKPSDHAPVIVDFDHPAGAQ